MARRDPDAAMILAQAEQQVMPWDVPGEQEQPSGYDPMLSFARMAKYYRFSDRDMDEMHYPRFFAYVRNANILIEEEKRQVDEIRAGGREPEIGGEELQVMFPQARVWDGK